jgi:TonB family protein
MNPKKLLRYSIVLNRVTLLIILTTIPFSASFGQTDFTKIKTFNKDSVFTGYKYIKQDSTICSSAFDSIQNREIFQFVDNMPVFGNGPVDLLNYIGKNLKYPSTDICFSGRVILRFIVESDGSLSNIKVLRGIEESVDIEAINVIKKMPVWKPGECNGTKVPVYYVVPVRFTLN